MPPVVWGSTYLVTSELLPPGYPVTAALLRALPAGHRGVGGVSGVALIALNNAVALDAVGIAAALTNTFVLAFGIVLTQK